MAAKSYSNRIAQRCSAKAELADRPLMTVETALAVETLFEVLANDTRLRILHAIAKAGEASTTDLSDVLDMKPQAVSNQLKRLLDRRVVMRRRQGNRVFYEIKDQCIAILLERGLCLIEESQC